MVTNMICQKWKYTNARSKVTVVCHEKDEFGDEHGEFEIRACNLLYGIGCPKCGGHYTYTLDEWKRKAIIRYIMVSTYMIK